MTFHGYRLGKYRFCCNCGCGAYVHSPGRHWDCAQSFPWNRRKKHLLRRITDRVIWLLFYKPF